jgi:transposase
LTTKIHALVDALGNPVEVMLSEGQDHDLTCAQSLIEAVDPGALIADKAFDADGFIAALNDRAIKPVIPSKSTRKTPRPCDFALYCERNLIERFFKKAQEFSGHRHPLRQARQDFPRRRSTRLRRHPPQLKTGTSLDFRSPSQPDCCVHRDSKG